ncbi:MAG: protein arginine kinase [Mariniblastus sp.]
MIDQQIDRNDVVISSRIRLARNISDFPFVSTCSDDQRHEIESTVRSQLSQVNQLEQVSLLDSCQLETLERKFLLDLQQIEPPVLDLNSTAVVSDLSDDVRFDEVSAPEESSSLDPSSEESLDCLADSMMAELEAVDFDLQHDLEFPLGGENGESCVTINEEDHLRLTVTRNDLNLEAAWDQINELDNLIEQHINYAFSPRWGYLTACPANVGTGMRVSVLVHLPALVLTGQADKVFRSLQRINVVARGVYGEAAIGDFFRISNQATLGVDESELIEQVTSVIPELVRFERQAREFLLDENREGVRRDVATALEQLCRWDLEDDSEQSHEQILSLISKVRMGISVGLLDQHDARRVHRLFAMVQLRQDLAGAVADENYRAASDLQAQIAELELGAQSSDRPSIVDAVDSAEMKQGAELDGEAADEPLEEDDPSNSEWFNEGDSQ